MKKIRTLKLFQPTRNFLIFLTFIIYNLVCFSIVRFIFFIKYKNYFHGLSFGEILISFFVGLRFDLSTICLVSGIFFLILLIPGRWKENKYFFKATWGLIIVFLTLTYMLLFIDIFYYEHAGKRLSFEIYTIVSCFSSLAVTVLMRYWYGMIFLLIFFAGLYLAWFKILNFLKTKIKVPSNIFNEIVCFFIFVVMVTISIRGGFQEVTLRPGFAFRNGNILLGHLSLNGVYTVLHTLEQSNCPARSFFPEKKAIETIRNIIKTRNEIFINDTYPLLRKTVYKEQPRKLNVVIFIMENWNANYIGILENYSDVIPFFDQLTAQGMLFRNFYSCGPRSWHGLMSVLFSLPPVFGVGITYPPLDQNIYRSMAHILKEQGYRTIFLHGGKEIEFSMKMLTRQLGGFEKSVFMEDFDLSKVKTDKAWGVHDEYVFLRAHEEFKKLEQPFLGVIFSLSSHDPYDIPEGFKYFGSTVPHANFLNSVRYSDWSLKQFFEKVKQSDYFDNTLFIIVADHAKPLNPPAPVGRFRIPCLFYAPGHIKKGINNRVGGQLDVLPSILDILKIDTLHSSFGKSLFEKDGSSGFSFMSENEVFYWIHNKYLIAHDLEKRIGTYGYIKDKTQYNTVAGSREKFEKLEQELLSFCQLGSKVLKDNLIYLHSSSE